MLFRKPRRINLLHPQTKMAPLRSNPITTGETDSYPPQVNPQVVTGMGKVHRQIHRVGYLINAGHPDKAAELLETIREPMENLITTLRNSFSKKA